MTNPVTTRYDRSMSTVHMKENEVTANFAGVLEKIRNGVEVIVEQDHRPVAVTDLLQYAGEVGRDFVFVHMNRAHTPIIARCHRIRHLRRRSLRATRTGTASRRRQ